MHSPPPETTDSLYACDEFTKIQLRLITRNEKVISSILIGGSLTFLLLRSLFCGSFVAGARGRGRMSALWGTELGQNALFTGNFPQRNTPKTRAFLSSKWSPGLRSEEYPNSVAQS